MEACDREDMVVEPDQLVHPPNGDLRELMAVGQEDNMQGQVNEEKKYVYIFLHTPTVPF